MIQLKSDREIRLMRQAGLLVWRAHQQVAEIIRPGVTTAEIDAVVRELFVEHNAVSLFKNYPNTEKGKPPFPACVCTSVNEVVVHGIPNNTPLKEGDIVSVDTGARLNGWCGDAAVTYRIGEVSPAVDRLVRITEETFFLAYKLMSTKTRWSQIAVEMSRFVRDHGYSTVECFVGHGVGRQLHEEPQVPNFLSRNLRGQGDFRIEPGLVIAVEPMVNMGTKKVKLLKDHWTQITTDKKPSSHYEHTIAVTRDGPRLLTEAPTPAEMELVLA